MGELLQFADYGVAALALIVCSYIVQIFLKSYQENTKALNKLTIVLEKSATKDEKFYSEVLPIMRSMNQKVIEIHEKVVK